MTRRRAGVGDELLIKPPCRGRANVPAHERRGTKKRRVRAMDSALVLLSDYLRAFSYR